MLKKILLTIVAILIAGGALMIYGTYKAADDFVNLKAPQLRQYAQMDEAEQNKYVLENADDLLTQAAANAKPDEQADVNLLRAIKDDPAVQKAMIELGRAVMAAAVLHSEEVSKNLNSQLRENFEREKSQFTERLEKYADVLEAAEAKLKAAQ